MAKYIRLTVAKASRISAVVQICLLVSLRTAHGQLR